MVTISIHASLQNAADWEKKNEATWVSRCLSSALMGYVQIAVTTFHEPTIAMDWLSAQEFNRHLEKQLTITEQLAVRVASGQLPSSVIGGNYSSLVFAHMGWCLKNFDIGKSFIAFSERGDVTELSTPFWREYARGMGALVRCEPYQIGKLRLRGQEKYWASYLRLIEVVGKGGAVESELAAIDTAFVRRNNDNSIGDDHYEIEGSGIRPVNWDFRRYGIINYLEANR